jgi:hypothetical protein
MNNLRVSRSLNGSIPTRASNHRTIVFHSSHAHGSGDYSCWAFPGISRRADSRRAIQNGIVARVSNAPGRPKAPKQIADQSGIPARHRWQTARRMYRMWTDRSKNLLRMVVFTLVDRSSERQQEARCGHYHNDE